MKESKEYTKVENLANNSGVMAGYIDTVTVTNIAPKKCQSSIPVLIEELARFNYLTDEELEREYRVNLEDLREYNIPQKITYNYVIKYKEIIDEYSQYGTICNEALNILDNNKMGTKSRLLRNINLLYKECKGNYLLRYREENLQEMDIIKKHADQIIDDIKHKLVERVLSDTNVLLDMEDVDIGIARIICYAFVECKILEKPKEVHE